MVSLVIRRASSRQLNDDRGRESGGDAWKQYVRWSACTSSSSLFLAYVGILLIPRPFAHFSQLLRRSAAGTRRQLLCIRLKVGASRSHSSNLACVYVSTCCEVESSLERTLKDRAHFANTFSLFSFGAVIR